MLASVRDANAPGAARRRQRRLRQWLRHERLSVAMALAEMSHHTAPRGQKMARAGGGARDELHGHAPDDAPPQGRILRHVMGHLPAPSLDVPVPQMVDQPVDILKVFAMLLPAVVEQVIDVPKIIQDVTPQRLRPPEPQQLVEQLVEVPTVVSYSSLQRTVEQIVDIPAPRGRGMRRVPGFLPEQSSTAQPVEQLVDIPSSRRGLYGSLPEQGTTAQTVEQIVDIPSGGVCGSGSSSAAAAADEDFTGVFRTFPHGKKVRSAGQVSL